VLSAEPSQMNRTSSPDPRNDSLMFEKLFVRSSQPKPMVCVWIVRLNHSLIDFGFVALASLLTILRLLK